MTFRHAQGHPERGRGVSIDRELQRALDVDPSPDFVARVRMRVASEPAPAQRWSWWHMVSAGAVLATLAVLAVVVPRSKVAPNAGGETLAANRLPVVGQLFTATAGGPEGPPYDFMRAQTHGSAAVVERPFSAANASTVVGQPFRAATAASAEAILDAREVATLRRLILNVGQGRVDLKPVLQPAPFAVADVAPLTDIDIVPIPEVVPISIEPLEERGGGARQ